MSVLLNGEIVLYGFVGENFWGDGFTARDVLDALADHGRDNDVTVRINSGGGYVDDGIAIFNALKAHKGKVTVIVDSMAASSASVIAMAGEERLMAAAGRHFVDVPSFEESLPGDLVLFRFRPHLAAKHAGILALLPCEDGGRGRGDCGSDWGGACGGDWSDDHRRGPPPDAFVHAYEQSAVTLSALVPGWRRRIAGIYRFPERV